MRLSKTIPLDEAETTRTATVRELTPIIVRNMVTQGEAAAAQMLEDLVKGNFAGLLGALGDCVELSADVGGPDGLSYSEIELIKTAFMEVNRAFFGLAAASGSVLLHLLMNGLNNSIAPAASSSTTDTAG